MLLLELMEANRQLSDMIYFMLLIIPSLLIYFRVDTLHRIYSHKGIRYFRDTFLYLAVAFSARMLVSVLGFAAVSGLVPVHVMVVLTNLLYAVGIFSMVMSVISLSYSLVWKDVESSISGRLKLRSEYMLYGLAAAIMVIDIMAAGLMAMGIAMLVIMGYTLHVTYRNYRERAAVKRRNNYMQMFFLVLILVYIIIIMTMLDSLISPLFPQFTIYVYVLTVGILWLMLFGILYLIDMKRD